MRIHLLCNLGSVMGVTPPDIYGKGVGGAELALMTTMEALAARGHDITVYNDPRDGERRHGGVAFMKVGAFDPADPVDALIIFRTPNAVLPEKTAAKRLIWWSTDKDIMDVGTRSLGVRADAVVCISPFHRSHMEGIAPWSKITVVDCGVRTQDYDEPVNRVPGRLIYCSVPDRGLVILHKAWPIIKAAVPHASLVITSDYRLWGLAAGNSNHRLAWAGLPDVQFFGAVSRVHLCLLQMSAEIMAYTCMDEELFCIAVAECQVAGAVPVTPDIGALGTTNEFGILVQEPVNSGGFVAAYAERVIALLGPYRDYLEKRRENMIRDARRRFNMETVADQWGSVLRGDPAPGA